MLSPYEPLLQMLLDNNIYVIGAIYLAFLLGLVYNRYIRKHYTNIELIPKYVKLMKYRNTSIGKVIKALDGKEKKVKKIKSANAYKPKDSFGYSVTLIYEDDSASHHYVNNVSEFLCRVGWIGELPNF